VSASPQSSRAPATRAAPDGVRLDPVLVPVVCAVLGAALAVAPAAGLAAFGVGALALARRLGARLLLLSLLGAGLGWARASAALAEHASSWEAARHFLPSPARCAGQGQISSSPVRRGPNLRFDAVLTALDCEGQTSPRPWPVRLYVPASAAPPLERGSRVSVVADLAPTSDFRNVGLPDPRPGAARRGAVLSGSAVLVELEHRSASGRALIDRARAHVRTRILATFAPSVSGLARALVLGESDLDAEDERAFQRSGLSHLLAVSGTHLVLAVLALVRGFEAVAKRAECLSARCDVRRPAALLGLCLAPLYADFAGGSGSAWRAAYMLCAVLGVRAIGRHAFPSRVLALSLAGGWLGDGLVVFDPSFMLSVGATTGLLVFGHRQAELPRASDLTEPRRPDPARLVAALARAALTTLAATIPCVPLLLSISPGLSLASVAANLLAAPLGEIVALPLCLAHALCWPFPSLERGVALVASGALVLIRAIAGAAASVEWLYIEIPPPNAWHLAALAATVPLALAPHARPWLGAPPAIAHAPRLPKASAWGRWAPGTAQARGAASPPTAAPRAAARPATLRPAPVCEAGTDSERKRRLASKLREASVFAFGSARPRTFSGAPGGGEPSLRGARVPSGDAGDWAPPTPGAERQGRATLRLPRPYVSAFHSAGLRAPSSAMSDSASTLREPVVVDGRGTSSLSRAHVAAFGSAGSIAPSAAAVDIRPPILESRLPPGAPGEAPPLRETASAERQGRQTLRLPHPHMSAFSSAGLRAPSSATSDAAPPPPEMAVEPYGRETSSLSRPHVAAFGSAGPLAPSAAAVDIRPPILESRLPPGAPGEAPPLREIASAERQGRQTLRPPQPHGSAFSSAGLRAPSSATSDAASPLREPVAVDGRETSSLSRAHVAAFGSAGPLAPSGAAGETAPAHRAAPCGAEAEGVRNGRLRRSPPGPYVSASSSAGLPAPSGAIAYGWVGPSATPGAIGEAAPSHRASADGERHCRQTLSLSGAHLSTSGSAGPSGPSGAMGNAAWAAGSEAALDATWSRTWISAGQATAVASPLPRNRAMQLSFAAVLFGALALLLVEAATRWQNSAARQRSEHLLRVTALDVGQGDATLVDLPDGRLMLIDGGGNVGVPVDPGERVILPVLRARRRDRLDILVLTHPHPDHLGGLLSVARELPIGELWYGGAPAPDGSDYQRLLDLLARHHVPRRNAAELCTPLPRTGAPSGSIPSVQILHPCPLDPAHSLNDNSLVLRITHGEHAALLMGDAELWAEQRLLATHPTSLSADLLKVAHHGSRTSSSPAFLRAVHPGLATISSGIRNRFGHPHPETLTHLQNAGALPLRLDQLGSITWQTDGNTQHLQTWLTGNLPIESPRPAR
jgi:ComEC/Rec2-related protein